MGKNEFSRRTFVGKAAAGLAGVAVSSSGLSMNAASYQRVKGANDRIRLYKSKKYEYQREYS